MTEKLMPIEPGCLCMVINSDHGHNGKVVTAVKFLGVESYRDGTSNPTWEIKPELRLPFFPFLADGAPECQLLRIDGNDFSHETEQEKERVEG